MINIKPFTAVRPTRDKAYLVATRSYLSYNELELAEKLNNNPFTFLHIINPPLSADLDFGPAKYRMVKEAYNQFVEEEIFTQEAEPSFYLYRQLKDGNEYLGLIAAVSIEDYDEGRIKKHENTLTNREEIFTDYLEHTSFNAEPVLLTYRDDFALDKIFAKYIEERAEYEFTSTDKVLHQLWLIEDKEDIHKIEKSFEGQKALYIADGHHRCASSSKLKERLIAKGKHSSAVDYFMAFLIGEEQMKVYDFNRLVSGLNGLNKEKLLDKIKKQFIVEPKHQEDFKPEKIHEIGMYIEQEWFKLVPKIGSFDPRDPVDHLDSQILSSKILDPILGIKDLKTDPRVSFLPGTEGLKALADKVDTSKYDVAFALFPATIEQIKAVADAEKVMPPKSTYIEPKLRSGLTIYPI